MDQITQILLQQALSKNAKSMPKLMASHESPDPDGPGMDVGIQPMTTPDGGDLTVGAFKSLMARDEQRRGLPGETPTLDPRIINPLNSPLMSMEGMKRGDIRLPSKANPYNSGEDLSNLENILREYHKFKR